MSRFLKWWPVLLAAAFFIGRPGIELRAGEISEEGNTGSNAGEQGGSSENGSGNEGPSGSENGSSEGPGENGGIDNPEPGDENGSEGEEDPGGPTEPPPPDDPVSDAELLQQARDAYAALSQEEKFYWLQFHDPGDWETVYARYHRGTGDLYMQALEQARQGDAHLIRLVLFMTFTMPFPEGVPFDPGPFAKFFQEPPPGTSVGPAVHMKVEQTPTLVRVGIFSFHVENGIITSIENAGEPVIPLASEDQFAVPPTVSSFFANYPLPQ